jgi:uncharacterized protein YndB with AHSA1/START domain
MGNVKCWLRDLEAAWLKENDRQRSEVTRESAFAVIELDIAAARQTVWEYFTVPGQRPKWRAADEVREASETGRRGVGTTNHCMHGAHAIIEEVIDWRPFDYLTFTTLLPSPGAPKIMMTYAFSENADEGTHIEIRVAKPKPKHKAWLEQVGAGIPRTHHQRSRDLRLILEAQAGASARVDEPSYRYRRSAF